MSRQDPKVRHASILAAALRMSRNYGYQNVTRADIAGAAVCSEALVSSYFGTMTQMRRAIVRAAIKERDLMIVAQALAAKDPHAQKAPVELRFDAMHSLIK